ncbi:MAG: MBL fold metallo-hydrolase [archaeon]
MRLTVLNDNLAGKKCCGEHGLSFLIEGEKKILFDAGSSDLFLKNHEILGFSPEDVELIVLSHGHWDHGNGLRFIRSKKLICHPECFIKRYKKDNDKYNGLALSLEDARKSFDLMLSKEPYQISENIVFLGEIPRMNDFEAKKTPFYKEGRKEDYIMDDSGIAIKSDKGLIVVTGCSHAGICNIIEYAKKVTCAKKVYAVLGGFHLMEDDEITKRTTEYFKKEKIEKIYPTHCTELPALARFYDMFKIKRIHSGDIIEL